MRGSRAALLAAAVALGLGLAACGPRGERKAATGAAGKTLKMAGRKELFGGDQRAWLTNCGDNADDCYCAASLSLPLAPKPAWVHEYSYAEFSDFEPQQLVHYDGLLMVSARSTQLMGLSASDGALVFNKDVYRHLERDVRNEALWGLLLHPAGYLICQDDLGRHYCWDITGPSPVEQWVAAPASQHVGAVVALGGRVLVGWNRRLRGLDMASGEQAWSQPTLVWPQGTVLSRSGVVVWWSPIGRAGAMRAEDGTVLWQLNLNAAIIRMTADDWRERVYCVRYDEVVECRDLRNGELIWEHSWADLLSAAERERLGRESGFTELARGQPLVIPSNSPMVAPEGLYLPLANGQVVALDPDGHRRWVVRGKYALRSGLGFANGLLLGEYYLAPGMLLREPDLIPFQVAPDWQRFNEASEEEQRTREFVRYIVRDPANGEILSSCELERPATVGPIPAWDKIAFGQDRLREGERARIVAYPWVEPKRH
jgi:outer membrane protein assembly factor BamB